jgi:hypothetical protein
MDYAFNCSMCYALSCDEKYDGNDKKCPICDRGFMWRISTIVDKNALHESIRKRIESQERSKRKDALSVRDVKINVLREEMSYEERLENGFTLGRDY